MINASSISAKTFNKTQLLSGIEQKNCAQSLGSVVRGNPRNALERDVEFPFVDASKDSKKLYMARARAKRSYTEKEQLEYRHEKRAVLYKGLAIASKVLPNYVNKKGETRQHSVCLCRRYMQTHENAKSHVVLSVDKNHIAKLNDLIVCDNSWLCPVCSSVNLDRKAKEITQVQKNFLEAGQGKRWSTWMMTLTIPHSRTDKLDDLLTKKSAVMSDLHAHSVIKKLKARIGWQGYVDSLEIKHGQSNGWHPHHHILAFCTNLHENTRVQCVHDAKRNYYRIATQHDKKTNRKIEKIEVQKYIYHVFAYLCVKHGLSRPSEDHGVDFKKSDDIQDYLTKQSKIALELTGEHSKTSGESRTQWEILRDCASENKQLASHSKALFLEFAEATKGKAKLHWSPYFKEQYLDEKEEEEIGVGDDEEEIVNEYIISAELWHRFFTGINRSHQKLLLKLAENDSFYGTEKAKNHLMRLSKIIADEKEKVRRDFKERERIRFEVWLANTPPPICERMMH